MSVHARHYSKKKHNKHNKHNTETSRLEYHYGLRQETQNVYIWERYQASYLVLYWLN